MTILDQLSELNTPYAIAVGILVLAVITLFIVEISAKLNDIKNDNVNIIIRNWAYDKFYFITFFFGIVTAHLFLGTTLTWFDCKTINIPFDCDIFNVLVVATLSILLLIIGWIFQKKRTTKTFQFILYSLGLLIGHYVWTMNGFS